MKKIAFTLAEVLICLVLIGILAAILINNMKFSDFKEKEFIATANKVLVEAQDALLQIRTREKTQCPMGVYTLNIAETNEYLLVGDDGSTPATSEDVINLIGKYIKFEIKFSSRCYIEGNDEDEVNLNAAKEFDNAIFNIDDFPEYFLDLIDESSVDISWIIDDEQD